VLQSSLNPELQQWYKEVEVCNDKVTKQKIREKQDKQAVESLFGICVLPNIKQRTNAEKGKTGRRLQRYSMHQYIIIEAA
jgi:hypothetical protein